MNFSQLQAFYQVAKNGSFTRAAIELNVSQPTVSMQVQALEKHYNILLLKRGIPLNNCVAAQNPSAIKHMVHLGVGGAFFPHYSIAKDVKKGKYYQIEIVEDLHLHIDLIYLEERRYATAIKNLVSIVKATTPPV